MRTKIILPVVLILLLAAGVLGFLFISGTLTPEDEAVTPIDTAILTKENEKTAFSFLDNTTAPLPVNMKGFVVDCEKDITITDTTEEGVKAAVLSLFDRIDAVQPDTAVIKYTDSFNYSQHGTDILSVLVSALHERNMYAVIYITDSAHDKGKAVEIAEKYMPDGIMYEMTDFTEAALKKADETRASLNEISISSGILVHDEPTAEMTAYIKANRTDFCFVQLNTPLAVKSLNAIKQWSSTALDTQTRVYAILRNDLVQTDEAWADGDEIYNQVRAISNYGGFSGYAVSSHPDLSSNKNETTADLYFYNEYFNDVDYTALTIDTFSIKDNSAVIITGTSDKEYPVFVRSSDDSLWQKVPSQGDEGTFTAEIPLRTGTNEVTIKHKNAMYTYCIDKAVDVMTASSAVIEDGIMTLTATAVKGASVWCSIANTIPVELTEVSSSDGYSQFTGTYEITKEYSLLTQEQVSFRADYNGLTEVKKAGKENIITPYDNHGLGNATSCIVTKNYAETTSTASPDDTSDPTCTPQLAGSYAYITECSVKDNIVVYSTDTGMKIHGEHSRLILGGYRMPPNKVRVMDVQTEDSTTIVFAFTRPVFVKTVVAPQEYHMGALERIYNVEEFTGEYIDILFMDTDECGYITEPDFSRSNVIEKAEWYSNTEEGFMTLRLYFRKKGDFAGYSLKKNDDGTVTISLKKTADTLAGTLIMLDPGHGGYGAPGTYSTSTVYEHEVTYSVALKTAEILRKYGAEVIITRGDNDSMTLAERVEMTRKYNPDVFVSIHCDGSEKPELFGTHTFYYKNYSMPLADAIHKQLVGAYRGYVYTDKESEEYTKADAKCKFFPYMVTRVEECPSVLVECGYLTNENDALFLTSENGQAVTATAIAQGIVDYIEKS